MHKLFGPVFAVIFFGNVVLGAWNITKGDALGSALSAFIMAMIMIVFIMARKGTA